MGRRTQWRGVLELRQAEYPPISSSDVACRMYDAGLSQLYGWYDDPALGGLQGTLHALKEADPHSVMGHALALGAHFGGPLDSTQISILSELARKPGVTHLEKLHAQAAELWAGGRVRASADIYERILAECPKDYLALRNIFMADFSLGREEHCHHMFEGLHPLLNSADPLYAHFDGMRAYSYCEVNDPATGEPIARNGLQHLPGDAWTTHALAHILGDLGRAEEAEKSILAEESIWCSSHLAGHIYWHHALHLLDLDKPEEALAICDAHVLPLVTPHNSLAMLDAASVLTRLQIRGVSVGSRMKDILEPVKSRLKDRMNPFQDVNYFLACSLTGFWDGTTLLREMPENLPEQFKEIRPVLASVYDGLEAFARGDYAAAVENIRPHNDRLVKFGGSRAQRDVVSQLYLASAMRSPETWHRKLARFLLNQRRSSRGDLPSLRFLESQMTAPEPLLPQL